MWDHTAIAADSKLMVSLSSANGPRNRRRLSCMMPRVVCVPGMCQRCSRIPMLAMSRRCWRRLVVVTPNRATAQGRALLLSSAGRKAWRMGKCKNSTKGIGSSGSKYELSMAKPVCSMSCLCWATKSFNTSVVERHNGTSRLRNQRKVRKTLAFSKATRYHRWMSWLAVGLYNFCRAHSSLKIKQEDTGLASEPGDGSQVSRPYLVDSGVVASPILGG